MFLKLASSRSSIATTKVTTAKVLNFLFAFNRNLSSKNPKKNIQRLSFANAPNLKDFLNNTNKEFNDEKCENETTTSGESLIKLNNLENIDEIDRSMMTPVEMKKKRKVFFEVYGCQMNINDTEIALSILNETGRYEKTNKEQDADIILIMTCSIRENAELKIWNRLKDFCHLKKKEPNLKIGILGCMAERLKEKIVVKEKMVDLIVGPDSYRSLPTLLDQSYNRYGNIAMNVQLSFEETYAEITPIRINQNTKTAFVSIQRGCDNMCSFCIVPFVRGRERSRSMPSIIDEVKKLSDMGIKEVTLLGQNVNSYRDLSETINVSISSKQENSSSSLSKQTQKKEGLSSKGFKTIYRQKTGGKSFTDLLEKVSRVDENMRIRFTSPHPKDFPDELITLMKERENICKTIHLPAQSGSTSCLERMRRGYTREAYLELVNKIREILPNIAFTSDFIAGFCGETEQEHEDTLSLINLVNYDFCFMYPYSIREKTKAYYRLEDNVPNEIKLKRYKEMVDTFRKSADQLNRSKIGQIHLVLIDTISKRSSDDYSGRNDRNNIVVFPKKQIPFIENENIRPELNETYEQRIPQIGDYVACKITGSTSQSLRAIPLFICKINNFEFNKKFF